MRWFNVSPVFVILDFFSLIKFTYSFNTRYSVLSRFNFFFLIGEISEVSTRMNKHESGMGKITVISIIFLFCFFSFAEAMFFTNSKDNDYPRIGKRPIPSSVYKTWLSKNEQIEYLPYGYQNILDRKDVADRSQGMLHWTNGKFIKIF